MDGPRDYHTKWNKSDRERQILYVTYIWNVKNDTDESSREHTADTVGEGEGGMN